MEPKSHIQDLIDYDLYIKFPRKFYFDVFAIVFRRRSRALKSSMKLTASARGIERNSDSSGRRFESSLTLYVVGFTASFFPTVRRIL